MQPAAAHQIAVADARIQVLGFAIVRAGCFHHLENFLFAGWQPFVEHLVVEMPFRVGTDDSFTKSVFMGMPNHCR